MREIQSTRVRTELPRILEEVARGETVIITRHGRAIARIVPETQVREDAAHAAIAGIRAIRKRTGRVTPEELLSAREEGRASGQGR